jgi:LPS sulfotransferase NodH
VNGVWASKMMWNYFADAVARMRAWPRLDLPPAATDGAVLATALPGLRYVWLRRDDRVRSDSCSSSSTHRSTDKYRANRPVNDG